MIPLYDESFSVQKFPWVTLSLVGLNTLVFFLTFLSSDFESIIYQYGAIPELILNRQNIITFITALFLHGGISHLLGNMWFLWIFGDNIENNLGRVKFIFFYIAAGVVSLFFHAITTSFTDIPVIGASGAISGVLGGYIILFPKNRVRAFIILGRPFLFFVPAFVYLGIWFTYQFLYSGVETQVAYAAHISGFLFGAIAAYLLGRPEELEHYTVMDDGTTYKRSQSGWEQ